ncbi:MAG: tail fiber protein [Bacteroidota bacterium]
MKKITRLALVLLILNTLYLIPLTAQVGINNDDSEPDQSAMLDVKSDSKGVLIPRMSSNDRQQILDPAVGLMVYDSTAQAFYYFNGMGWLELLSASVNFLEDDDGDTQIQVEESADEDMIRFDVAGKEVMLIDNVGNVGIGKIPTAKLDIDINVPSGSEIILINTGSNHVNNTVGSGSQWQSFTATCDCAISKFGVFHFSSGDNSGSTLDIFEGEGTSGNLLYSTTANSTTTITGTKSRTDFLVNDLSVSTDSIYTFRVNQFDRALWSASDVYSGGRWSGIADRDLGFQMSGRTPQDIQFTDNGLILGNYILPYTDGSNGQSLVTDGSGMLNWTTPIDTDDQTLAFDGTNLSIVDGNSLDISSIDTDTDDQTLSFDGTNLSIADGNSVDLSPLEDDGDWETLGATNITNANEGNVGIGDIATTQARWQLSVKDTSDAMLGTDSIDVSGLHAVFMRNRNENNTGIGIGFQSSTSNEIVGAAIVHERTSSNSRGKLHFATKASGSAADEDLPVRMTIGETGNVGIGTVAPNEKLHVIGNIRMEDGNEQAGYILTSDANGVGRWEEGPSIPIGTIQMWPTSTPPTGWLVCNGSTFNAGTYPELNTVLGGNTLPNFNGRFPLGAGSSGTQGAVNHTLGTDGGQEDVTLNLNQIPAHTHNVTVTFDEGRENGSNNTYSNLRGGDSESKTYTSTSAGGDNNGNTVAHENMPPFYTINFIIKAK